MNDSVEREGQAVEAFTRGFFWGDVADCPAGFIQGPLECLYVARDAHFVHSADVNGSITILGLCVSVHADEHADLSWTLLEALGRGEAEFLAVADQLSGRYVVFARQGKTLRVFSDATAMRSVFYRSDLSAVASHARILSHAEAEIIPFEYGYPGNATPLRDVKILTPNTLIEITYPQWGEGLNTIRRFWPRRYLASRTTEDVAEFAFGCAVNAIKRIARVAPVRMALTAGLDSRAMLAVLLESGIDFQTYTYGGGADTATDVAVAVELASSLGLRHTFIRCRFPKEMLSALQTATYAAHHFPAVEPLAEWFDSRDEIAISANLLEIGRTFYGKYGVAPPITPGAMREIHYRSMPKPIRTAFEDHPTATALAEAAFSDMIAASDYNAAREIISPYDQFYWEHRMCAWHGVNMLERDFYAQAFIPFNARTVWDALLSLPEKDRRCGAAFHHMVSMCDHDLMAIPINPDQWPVANDLRPES